ncbi:hypothetical protein [Shewanella vaxholmensis]|uniref:Uncharacterized protein n=1 Tax=Shewanella vaxholmensis TaxID=3063535 RepID=A0ABU9USE9_9GAMM|nr:hypothetical protein [Shewanella sp. SP1S1-4]MDT3309122.1 hypothetical protein [Shewanella sp. SP1S1-4]
MKELPTSVVLEKFKSTKPQDYKLVAQFQDWYFNSFMDVLGIYIEWRPRTKNPKGFLERLLKDWGIKHWIPEYPPAVLKKMITNSYTTLSINDVATISMALSALLVDDKIGKQLKERAIVCIERQSTDLVLSQAGHKNLDTAKDFWGKLKVLISESK